MKYVWILLLSTFCLSISAQKESVISELKAKYEVSEVNFNKELNTPSSIFLGSKSKLKKQTPKSVVSELFNIDQKELEHRKTTKLGADLEVFRFKRTIQGIPVAHGEYTVLSKNGENQTIFSEHYELKKTQAVDLMSAEEALQCVLPKLKSELFSWESTENILKNIELTEHQREALELSLINDMPQGEKVWIKDYEVETGELELAYQFIIESVTPEFRDKVYVSAEDGRILLRDAQLKHGIGDTRYSGRKVFPTTTLSINSYELKGTESLSGIFCETRSLEGVGGLPVSSPAIIALSEALLDGDEGDFCPTDDMGQTIAEFGDDEWDLNEHKKVPFDGTLRTCCPTYVAGQCSEIKNDDIALDAQWGAAMVARYWKDIHNRNGYDDQGSDLLSFVHHGEAYENASWNGIYMKYGDGSYQGGYNSAANPLTLFGPLVSLDVCAHEIGHAICTSTSDLVYTRESGAMNEAFSDIWAAAIEQYALDFVDGTLDFLPWGIAEQADERDMGNYNNAAAKALRWMDHPPAENNPDTYGAGTWWQDPDCASPNVANDFCGIHFNSGVMNKWFYLLTEGSGKALSPGLGKPAFDDQVNDKMNAYSVTGIGMRKSEKITYGAELLLLPNAKFVDMRVASIAVARSLYGPCSNEEKQTTNAWYAVGVGAQFGNCGPTIEFNYFNKKQFSEFSPEFGCDASKIITLQISSFAANAIVNFNTGGTAVQGEDYDLITTSLAFSGSENKSVSIKIYDDKVEEDNDTIIISFDTGVYSDADTIIIVNDDGIPAVGSLAVLLDETFDTDDGSWSVELLISPSIPDTNILFLISSWYVDGGNSNHAHVSINENSSTPTYNQSIASHVRLRSPLVNAIGRKDVEISFDWEAGGERDAVDTTALFDYGTFQISFDGLDWENIENFVGTGSSGGQVSKGGNYIFSDPSLQNKTFYIGYEWQNDELNGSSFSFKIDNVVVTGAGLEIESDIGGTMSAKVPPNERIGFISTDDFEVIAIIEEAKADLGCTSFSIIGNDAVNDQIESICKYRGSKVFKIETTNASDSIRVTLFYRATEVDEWDNAENLNILSVADIDILNEGSGYEIIDNSEIVVNDQRSGSEGYITYTFWTSSSYKAIALTDRPAIPENLMVMNDNDSGILSLRNQIENACGGDTIRFDINLIGDTIKLTSGEIMLDHQLVIIGNGVSETVLSGNLENRIFHVFDNIDVSLMELKVIKGSNPTNGGAIYNKGQLHLKNITFEENFEGVVKHSISNEGDIFIKGTVRVK